MSFLADGQALCPRRLVRRPVKPETERWLDRAAADLKTATNLLEMEDQLPATFHAQQAAEKALKALLIETEDRFPKIHNLVTLAARAKAPEDVAARCRRINPAYVVFRYPDAEQGTTNEEAVALVNDAREVLGWVHRQLS